MISTYYDGADVLTEANGSSMYTRISPSGVSKFFSQTRQWYGETFLSEPGFEGSTSSVLGSIVHYFAELGAIPADAATTVDEYLDTITIDIDRSEIRALWKDMATVLIEGCITGKRLHSKEQFIYTKLLPHIYLAGTYDALRPTGNGNFTLRDYKTAATKPSGISYEYRMQLHTYAYILKQNGIIVDTVELEYVTRPTKTLPCRHFHFSEPFTEEDYLKIESQLMTIASSCQLWAEQPELRWALAQDYRLKPKLKPKLFKD